MGITLMCPYRLQAVGMRQARPSCFCVCHCLVLVVHLTPPVRLSPTLCVSFRLDSHQKPPGLRSRPGVLALLLCGTLHTCCVCV